VKAQFVRYVFPIALLLLMLAQLVAASPSQSAAFDEGYTITYGYAYLRGGDARLSRGQNPPLTNVLIALPLLLRDDIVFPVESVNWTTPDIFGFTDEFMWQVNPDPQRLVQLARLPEMLLALLLACVVYAFTRQMFGEAAALAALVVCTFDPNILAHGHIVGTDLGVSFFMFAAVWAWAAALKRGSLKHALVAGLLAGAALSTKYSAVWLGPILLLLGLILPVNHGRNLPVGVTGALHRMCSERARNFWPGQPCRRSGPEIPRRGSMRLLRNLLVGSFRRVCHSERSEESLGRPTASPVRPRDSSSHALSAKRGRAWRKHAPQNDTAAGKFLPSRITCSDGYLRMTRRVASFCPRASRVRLLIALGLAAGVVVWGTFAFSVGPIEPGGPWLPAPQYWQSLASVYTRVELNTPAFLLGQLAASGFPGYYPFAFVVKTPLPTLILLCIGSVSLIRRRARREVAVWLPPLLFMLAAMFGGLNLGYRLMLPVLPFALMIAGQGVSVIVNARSSGRIGVLAALGVWLVADVLSTNPDHLAYFNQLVDHERDYDVLVDSNLDWGQDLIALREWQRTRQLDALNVAYYGSARPAAYRLNVNLLPGFSLRDFGPEIDGFTAYALPPGWYAISASSLQLGLLYSRWGLYEPFKNLQPVERVGRSFLIYHVTYPVNEIDRTVVLGPLAGDLDRATLGASADRQLIVKWAGADAAVIDMQGAARYVARGGEPIVGFAPDVHNALIAAARRLGSDAGGQLRLFEIDTRTALDALLPAWSKGQVRAPDGTRLDLPLRFEGGLTLLGYDLAAQPAGPFDLVTYWQVERPPDQPLAIFAHVLDADARIIAQRDGLNVKLGSLEAGDILLQHFTLERLAATKVFEIGLYDPSNGQRKPAAPKTDRVELTWK
jgi:hypothetical protein